MPEQRILIGRSHQLLGSEQQIAKCLVDRGLPDLSRTNSGIRMIETAKRQTRLPHVGEETKSGKSIRIHRVRNHIRITKQANIPTYEKASGHPIYFNLSWILCHAATFFADGFATLELTLTNFGFAGFRTIPISGN